MAMQATADGESVPRNGPEPAQPAPRRRGSTATRLGSLSGLLAIALLLAVSCRTADPLEISRDCSDTANVTINWGATSDSRATRYEVFTRTAPGASAVWQGWSSINTPSKTYNGTSLANRQFQIALRDANGVYEWGPWASLQCGGGPGPNNGPNINAGQDGANLNYSPVFTDEFNNLNNWIRNDMSDGLHQVGNDGLDGKRWSAWYNAHQDQTARTAGGQLIMGGRVVQQADSSRNAVQDNDLFTEFNRYRFYTGWVQTLSREYSNAAGTQVEVRPPSGNDGKWGPGHFIEVDVDFSNMDSNGFRLSAWMMPADPNVLNKTYDADPGNGVEIDLFEYEVSPGAENLLLSKVIAGDACGNTPGGVINAGSGIRSGSHTIGLLWMRNRLVWYVDGVERMRDTRLVPQVPHYLIISREMNSGAKDATDDGYQPGVDLRARPGVPKDPGLYATNVWRSKDKINTDKGRVNSVKVWSVNDNTSDPNTTC